MLRPWRPLSWSEGACISSTGTRGGGSVTSPAHWVARWGVMGAGACIRTHVHRRSLLQAARLRGTGTPAMHATRQLSACMLIERNGYALMTQWRHCARSLTFQDRAYVASCRLAHPTAGSTGPSLKSL